jgi:hypothetical protein
MLLDLDPVHPRPFRRLAAATICTRLVKLVHRIFDDIVVLVFQFHSRWPFFDSERGCLFLTTQIVTPGCGACPSTIAGTRNSCLMVRAHITLSRVTEDLKPRQPSSASPHLIGEEMH